MFPVKGLRETSCETLLFLHVLIALFRFALIDLHYAFNVFAKVC